MRNRFILASGCAAVGIIAAFTDLSRCTAKAAEGPDIVVNDFEAATYGDWKTTGTAFGSGPTRGELARKLELDHFIGDGVCTTKVEGDGPVGTLTSPPFKIERHYVSFLISGGDYEHHACLNLMVKGQVVHSATGRNSVHLTPASWDVSSLIGQMAQIQIVDQARGGWGHIDVDQIVETNNPERLPVTTEPLYQETLRPQFHFTARQWTMDRLNPGMRQEGWLNDLNGLIYYEGEYHLFAQRWNKCWIHAVSKDLVHWTELQPAFWEESLDSAVQSGTCVIDYQNTSKLSPSKATPPLVAFWPRNDNHSQCVTYSLDHGRTWKFYDKNPVLDHPERDPKVFWYPPAKHWVMILYGQGAYQVFTSQNLVSWKDEHKPVPNSYECPDLIEMPVDGDKSHTKWAMIQGDGKYSLGTFDGVEFKEESKRFSCDIGPNFYATQTWANTDTGDGRRIQAAWMRDGHYPQMPFNQQVTFPCELTLHTTPQGLRIFREPIKELALLREKSPAVWKPQTLADGTELPLESSGDLYEIQADVKIPELAKLIVNLRGASVELGDKGVTNGRAHGDVQDSVKTVQILLDRTSIETFSNHGEVSSSRCFLPKGSTLSIKAEGGPVEIRSLAVYTLHSAWAKQ